MPIPTIRADRSVRIGQVPVTIRSDFSRPSSIFSQPVDASRGTVLVITLRLTLFERVEDRHRGSWVRFAAALRKALAKPTSKWCSAFALSPSKR